MGSKLIVDEIENSSGGKPLIVGSTFQEDTLATLRARTTTPDTVWVSGYHTKDDGAFGSNIFRWNSTSTEDDNSGTIIKLDSVATGRYLLRYSGSAKASFFGDLSFLHGSGTTAENNSFTGAAGEVVVDTTNNRLRVHNGSTAGGHPVGDYVNVKDYGAKGDFVASTDTGTDDTTAIQNALDAAGGRTVYLPAGNYLITSPLQVPTNSKIVGDGWSQYEDTIGWYGGAPVNGTGTSIISKSQWATLELIGTDPDRISRCIIRDIELIHYPASNPGTTFGDNAPLYTTSTGISSHYGGGHKIQNVKVARYGYSGIELGINRTYNGTAYDATDSTGGRGSNTHISDVYWSGNFCPGILIHNEQIHITNSEGDSYQLPSQGGYTNPNTSSLMSAGIAIFNSVGIFITNCHMECHEDRGYGLYIDRLSSGTYPTQINISNCKFYNGIVGAYIGAGVLASSITSSNFDGTFSELAADLTGKCTLGNSTISSASSKVDISNDNSIIESCLFKDVTTAIDITYRGNVKDNSFNNCSTGIFISASSTNGIVIDNNKSCVIDLNGLPILNSMFINDDTLGVSTIGSKTAYKHIVYAPDSSIAASGSKDIIKIVPNGTTTYKNQLTVVKVESIFDGLQGSSTFNTVHAKVTHFLRLYYSGANFVIGSELNDAETNYAITAASDISSTSTPAAGEGVISIVNYDATNAHYTYNYVEITGRYYGFHIL